MRIMSTGQGATVLAVTTLLTLCSSLAANAAAEIPDPVSKIDSFYTFANGSTGVATSANVNIETGLSDQHPAATSVVTISGITSVTPALNSRLGGWACWPVDTAVSLQWACWNDGGAVQNGPYGFMLELPSVHGSVKVVVTTGFKPRPVPGTVPVVGGPAVTQSYSY